MTLEEQKEYIDLVRSESDLKKLYKSISNEELKSYIMTKINDQKFLYEIVQKDSSIKQRLSAFSCIKDVNFLKEVALYNSAWQVRYKATTKIEDKEVLCSILLRDDNYQVRARAAKKLNGKFLFFKF